MCRPAAGVGKETAHLHLRLRGDPVVVQGNLGTHVKLVTSATYSYRNLARCLITAISDTSDSAGTEGILLALVCAAVDERRGCRWQAVALSALYPSKAWYGF